MLTILNASGSGLIYKKVFVLLVLLLLACKTSTPKIESPKDYSDVLHEVKKSTELKQNPRLQNKIINTIEEQSNYSKTCYNKLQELEERLNKLESENERLRKENERLREQLETWNKIQFGFWLAIGLLLLAFLIKLLSPFIKTLVRV